MGPPFLLCAEWGFIGWCGLALSGTALVQALPTLKA